MRKKIDKLTEKLGAKMFPKLPQEKSKSLAFRILIFLFVLAICIIFGTAMRIAAYRQMQKYNEYFEEYQKFNEIFENEEYQSKAGENGLMEDPEAEISDEKGLVMDDKNSESERWTVADYAWDELLQENEACIGWIYMPTTPINYAVVSSDDDFYLAHDFTGNENILGCPFMEKVVSGKDIYNRVIYGHNMGDGTEAMFSCLLKYKDKELDPDIIFYFTDLYDRTREYQLMAVVPYNTADVEEWDFRRNEYGGEDSYYEWIKGMRERSTYFYLPEDAPESVLTLVTCDRSEYGKEGRLLFIGAEV